MSARPGPRLDSQVVTGMQVANAADMWNSWSREPEYSPAAARCVAPAVFTQKHEAVQVSGTAFARWRAVIRAATLLIVLAVGAHAPLGVLCKALCSPSVAAASGCHPPATADTFVSHMAAAHDCDQAATEQAALVRDDGRRDVSTLGVTAAPVLLPAPHQMRLEWSAGRHGPQVSLNRPRSTPLRI